MHEMLMLGGALFWVGVGIWLFLIRSKSPVHRTLACHLNRKRKLILALLTGLMIALLGVSMTFSPVWNGEITEHRNQYELITESFLKGRLDFDYEVDPALLALDNPYDAELRTEAGVDVHFDHAFYQGKYYMYFGVVPVLVAFMPYRLITGHALITWQATFLFTAIFVIGLTVYLHWLVRKFFRKMTWGTFLSLLIAFVFASTVYLAKYPSLYQTPVACGMMFEIWSLFCFSAAFLDHDTNNFPLGLALIGSLLGALTFGCRPPLAMANLLLVPILIRFLKGKKISKIMLLRLTFALLPWLIVAAGLMWYNDARFDSPFEFGQSYQLTVTDQTAYSSLFTLENLVRAPAGLFNSLFVIQPMIMVLPYLQAGNGAFGLCPLLLLSLAFLMPRSGRRLKQEKLYWFAVTAVLTVALITVLQIVWSPRLLDRYQSDFVWLLSVGAFCGAGTCFSEAEDGIKLSRWMTLAAFCCVILAVLTFLIPNDGSFTDYDRDALLRIWNIITFRAIR